MAVAISLYFGGNWSWFAVLFVFVGIPVVELILGARGAVIDEDQLRLDEQDRTYDILLYSIVPIQCFLCFGIVG